MMAITALRVRGDSGTEYTITVNADGVATCTCPSYRFQTKWCKHLAFVYDTLHLEVAGVV